MRNILLVEPDYRSKFPPLGLLRIASYHKRRGDLVTFTRGRDPKLRAMAWHRVYVASLFTYELPRTVATLKYYRPSVEREDDLIVGGIGATLLPEYIRERIRCRIVLGPLSEPRMVDGEKKPIAKYIPDYSLLEGLEWEYQPSDAYFCRVTTGCIRRCKFCAVPALEPKFGFSASVACQISEISRVFGERQNLVLLDNNLLASPDLKSTIREIRKAGFETGAKRAGRERTVDMNQGIDARLVSDEVAEHLATIALSPVRLAFDQSALKKDYTAAIRRLTARRFFEFTNYVMFNYNDTPEDFYQRIRFNASLSQEMGIRVTGFPMRYSPVNDVTRRFVSSGWMWRYLRGMQCVLLATHGLVSPRLEFFEAAFGRNAEEFLEILSMPDRYIIYRRKYERCEATSWKRLFRRLSPDQRNEFLATLARINRSRQKRFELPKERKFRALLEHYYPNGAPTPCL
jgi:hypothetical protein